MTSTSPLDSEGSRALLAEARDEHGQSLNSASALYPGPWCKCGDSHPCITERLADTLEASLSVPDTDNREAMVEAAARACFTANNGNKWTAEDWDAEWLSERTREVWRNYARAVLAVLPVLSRAAAPEPEWEYGLKLRGSIVRVGSQEAIRVHQSIWGGEIVRHPSGPWEPLAVGGESDG